MYSSNETDDFIGTSAVELSRMLVDPIADERLQTTFEPYQTLYAVLRQYHFVTRGLNHILYNLTRHLTERNTLYHSLMTSIQFQEMLEPILMDFRRRQRMNDPSPLVIPVILPPSTTTSSPQSVLIASLPLSTTPIDNPPTSASPSGSNRSFLSYYTASQEELGTPTHPIDVDLLPDQQVTRATKRWEPKRTPSTLTDLTSLLLVPTPYEKLTQPRF
jgi:hypothetical protein